MMVDKRCSLCENDLLYTDFYKDKRNIDGLCRRCKVCMKRVVRMPDKSVMTLTNEYMSNLLMGPR